jgi:hypothetical protein
VCDNLNAFDDELQKGGYWLRNAGYGYPMYGYMFAACAALIN